MLKQTITILFILVVAYFHLGAQPAVYAFDHYNTENELSGNEVNDIAQMQVPSRAS